MKKSDYRKSKKFLRVTLRAAGYNKPWGTLCLLGKAVTANLFEDLTQEKSLWPRIVKRE